MYFETLSTCNRSWLRFPSIPDPEVMGIERLEYPEEPEGMEEPSESQELNPRDRTHYIAE